MVAIRDVAEHAGVSTMSVSRVLNDSPLVTDVTRQRVLRSMSALGYTPNAAARSLKRGRTKLLGVLLPNSNNPIYNLYVDGIKDAAAAAGYSVILSKIGGDLGPGMEASARLLHEQRIAGVIITYSGWHDQVFWLMRHGVQVVCIDHRVHGCDHITLDNVAAIGRGVAHLARLGHRRIGMITGPLNVVGERERLVGYRRAMRAHGLPLERRLQRTGTIFTDECGFEVARALLTEPDRPSALITSSTSFAPGVLMAAADLGLRIPEELALVGLGEMSWSPTLVSPITSLVEPAYEMGATACRMLIERLGPDDPGPARTRVYRARLAVRISCGAPVALRDAPIRAATSLLFSAVSHDKPSPVPPPAGLSGTGS